MEAVLYPPQGNRFFNVALLPQCKPFSMQVRPGYGRIFSHIFARGYRLRGGYVTSLTPNVINAYCAVGKRSKVWKEIYGKYVPSNWLWESCNMYVRELKEERQVFHFHLLPPTPSYLFFHHLSFRYLYFSLSPFLPLPIDIILRLSQIIWPPALWLYQPWFAIMLPHVPAISCAGECRLLHFQDLHFASCYSLLVGLPFFIFFSFSLSSFYLSISLSQKICISLFFSFLRLPATFYYLFQ